MTRNAESTQLIERLRSVLLRQRLVLFAAGILTTIAALLATWIFLSLLANVMVLPVWFKILILIVAAGLAAWVFTRFALRRLFDGDIDQVAIGLEQKHPELKGRLIA